MALQVILDLTPGIEEDSQLFHKEEENAMLLPAFLVLYHPGSIPLFPNSLPR